MACTLGTQDSKRSSKWSNGFCQMKFAWGKLKLKLADLGGGCCFLNISVHSNS